MFGAKSLIQTSSALLFFSAVEFLQQMVIFSSAGLLNVAEVKGIQSILGSNQGRQAKLSSIPPPATSPHRLCISAAAVRSTAQRECQRSDSLRSGWGMCCRDGTEGNSI